MIAKAGDLAGDEEGTTIAEYTTILAAVCMVCIAALFAQVAFTPVSYAFP